MPLILFFIFLAFSCVSVVRKRMLLSILNVELAAQTWYFSSSSRERDLAVVVLKAHQPEKRQHKRQFL